MIKEKFFPTIIYGKDIELDNNLFEREIVEWSNRDPGLKKTNRNGWHSTTEMHKMPVFKPLVDELFIMMNDIWKEEWLDREPLLGNMWANINPPGGYNAPHIHPNSLFSGVYYVKTPNKSGKLSCMDPRPGANMMMPIRKTGKTPPRDLWREAFFEVKKGRALIFPSWLWHSVEPNQSNDIRISVSFNFIQHGFQ
jgi:uncharacterized protein (TIGR02466 family)